MSGGVFRGGCALRTDVRQPVCWWWGCVPTVLVVWPEASQHWRLQAVWRGQVSVPKSPPPEELTQMCILWGLCQQCPCLHSEPQLNPASPGDPLRPAGRSSPGSYGVTALPWVPVHVKPCVCPPRVESLFPPVLCSSCAAQAPLAFKAKCSRGSSSWCQTPRLGSLTLGSELSLLGEPLRYNYFSVCGSPTWWVWDLIISQKPSSYCLIMASCLWM